MMAWQETVAWIEAWICLAIAAVILPRLLYDLTLGERKRRREGRP